MPSIRCWTPITDQRKHQSSASLAFVRGIHRWPEPTQRASNAGNVYIWWRHHLIRIGHSPVWILRVVLLSWPSGQVSVWSWATLARSLFQFWKMTMASVHPWYHCLWGQHGAHLGPTGPRWAPCWPYEPRYLGIVLAINFNTNMGK